MGFWIFMFICNVMIPLVMAICGYFMWKHTPKSINAICGYRTKRSMKNMETWKFAHEFCGKLWWKIGWIMLVPSILLQLPFIRSTEDVVGGVGAIICTIECAVLILSIVPTEKALQRTFDSNGVRR